MFTRIKTKQIIGNISLNRNLNDKGDQRVTFFNLLNTSFKKNYKPVAFLSPK
jgi:hypothetical protein